MKRTSIIMSLWDSLDKLLLFLSNFELHLLWMPRAFVLLG